jgi:hypothetical protein
MVPSITVPRFSGAADAGAWLAETAQPPYAGS